MVESDFLRGSRHLISSFCDVLSVAMLITEKRKSHRLPREQDRILGATLNGEDVS